MPRLSPKQIHELDQVSGAISEYAGMLKRFRKGLVEAGFSDDEAYGFTHRLEGILLHPLLDEAEELTKGDASE